MNPPFAFRFLVLTVITVGTKINVCTLYDQRVQGVASSSLRLHLAVGGGEDVAMRFYFSLSDPKERRVRFTLCGAPWWVTCGMTQDVDVATTADVDHTLHREATSCYSR
jgi:hypothetical protein